MRALVVLLLCACGRIDFDPYASAGFGDRGYPNFLPCPPELVMVDAANCNGGAIDLTPEVIFSTGAVWVAEPYATDTSISMQVTFQFASTGITADGAAIVLQNDPRGVDAVGMTGNGLGYESIAPSVGLEVDSYDNGDDPPGPHLAIDVDGVINGTSQLSPIEMGDATPFTVWFDYASRTHRLAAYIARTPQKPATPLVTQTFDLAHLGPTMWVGITASTGEYAAVQRVLAWHIDVTP